MLKKFLFTVILILATALCASGLSFAAPHQLQNPNLNWGNTCGLDAKLPPPGLYFSNYIVDYSADKLTDPNGDKLMNDPVDAVVYAPQFIYVHDKKYFQDYNAGFQLFPTILQSYNPNDNLNNLTSNEGNFGDLIFGPFIGKTAQLAEGFNLHWIFEFDTYFPIGEYNENKTFNPGANYWTFEPWVTLTMEMPYGLTVGTRQHLAYNTENEDTDKQNGILYHFNYSVWKNLSPLLKNLQIGAVGYYGKQLTENEDNGNDINGSKEEVFAIGPAVSWKAPTGTTIRLKGYFESGAENRPEGEKVVLRLIQKLL